MYVFGCSGPLWQHSGSSVAIWGISFPGGRDGFLRAQPCPTPCNPVDCGPPGSSARGILQARMLEWAAMPFSRGSPQPRDWTRGSCIASVFFTIWATREAPWEGPPNKNVFPTLPVLHPHYFLLMIIFYLILRLFWLSSCLPSTTHIKFLFEPHLVTYY